MTSVRSVVEYFNAGIPQDRTAGGAATLDARFTSPRGNGTRGLGLTPDQIGFLTDFLENGLYDPTFAASFQPTSDDLNFSVRRPSLAARGAVDGVLLSGSAIDNNDPLSRRDQGLEFLDVTARVDMRVTTSGTTDTWVITNKSGSVIDTHLLVIVKGLPAGVTVNATEQTRNSARPGGVASGEAAGQPFYRMFLTDGVLNKGASTSVTIVRTGGSSSSYQLKLLSGQGTP